MKKFTKETLQNTYGVVESKEHAEFIVELCNENGVKVFNLYSDDITNFMIKDGQVRFTRGDLRPKHSNLKKITIPLPPKSEGDNLTPKEESELKHKKMVAALSVGSIEPKWQDGAVCFAAGEQNFIDESLNNDVAAYILSFDGFQLNTIKIGDCIEASELDTERKYNDVVEVFGLFGWSFPARAVSDYESLEDGNVTLCDVDFELYQNVRDTGNRKRKLTYPQLMAIGKLKRAMIERDKSNNSESTKSKNPLCRSEFVDLDAATWPQVGDEAITGTDRLVSILSIDDRIAWVKYGEQGHYNIIPLSQLKKPKSPQDLLIEELQTKLCENNYVDNYTLANDIVNGMIEGLVYNPNKITGTGSAK